MTKKKQDASAGSRYVLGFDGGGTKSICVVAREDGEVVGVGASGISNFQGVGVVHAGQQVKEAVDKALAMAGITAKDVVTAAYGVAGADREADFDIVASYVEPNNPADWMLLSNDTTIALRAGTVDGVGLALICGTGANCIGFNGCGVLAKVGGLGRFSGDPGGGEDIVERAIIAGLSGEDGRGPKTLLYRRLAEALGVEALEDLIAFFYPDDYHPVELGKLAPVVFATAAEGDIVARRLLENVGDQLGKNAVAAARRLFKKQESFPIVLGGSILQKSKPPILVERLTLQVSKHFPNASIVRLTHEPVMGAVFFALDLMHGRAGKQRMARVIRSYKPLAVR